MAQTWHNGADTPWWHIIISWRFLEDITSSFFAVFASEHISCSSCLLQCTISSQAKTLVRIANNAAKLTISARWRLLNMADDHFLWRQLKHCCAHSIFSTLWWRHRKGLFKFFRVNSYMTQPTSACLAIMCLTCAGIVTHVKHPLSTFQ